MSSHEQLQALTTVVYYLCVRVYMLVCTCACVVCICINTGRLRSYVDTGVVVVVAVG